MLGASLLLQVLFAGGPIAALPPAEKLQISATAQAGSGLSLAGAGGETLLRRSPVFLNVDVGFTHPQVPWLEFAPTAMLELEGRVSFGLMPKLRAFVPLKSKRWLVFGSLGVPVVVAPFTLVGVAAGVGLGVSVHKHIAIVGEGIAAGYFVGSDLIEGGGLGKFDLQGGVRVSF